MRAASTGFSAGNEAGRHLVALGLEFVAACLEGRGNLLDQLHEPVMGEVGAAVERLEVGRQENRHGPAAAAGHQLHRVHVDGVQIGPFFAVDLDRYEVLVHEGGHVVVLEDLVFHDVAPVTTRVADGQEDRLVLRAGLGQCGLAPGIPVDGVVGVLLQVQRGLVFEVVAVATDDFRRADGLIGLFGAGVAVGHGAPHQ